MEILLDTANLDEIKEYSKVPWISGVTTNPTFFKKQGIKNIEEFISTYFKITKQKLHLELMDEADEHYFTGDHKITAKVPYSPEGVSKIAHYKNLGIKVNVHLVYSVNQALIAAKARADYICVLMGRLDDVGQDSFDTLSKMKKVYDTYRDSHGIVTKIMGASIRHPKHVEQAAMIGLDSITIPYSILTKMHDHPLTSRGILEFEKDNCGKPLYG